jgi:hypothetical protein
MKMYGGVKVYIHAFLTSALDEGEWSASCPTALLLVSIRQGAAWAPELVCTLWR